MIRVAILSLFLLGSSLQAQIFFDLGLKGGYGGNLMLNSNVFDDDDLTHKFSSAYTVGAKLGLNFTMESALAIEFMYSGYSQDFNYKTIDDIGSDNTGLRGLDYNSMDMLLLYRKTAMGQYVEIGGEYGIVGKATFNDENISNAVDIINQIEKNRLKAVVGFGSNIMGGEMTLISIGLRVKYDFTDFFQEAGSGADTVYGKVYDPYKSTNPLTALLILEINQGIGYFAQRSCPKRVKYFNYD